MIRLFTGIELPESVKTRLTQLSGGIKGARWQTPEQMHLTLKFIGEVEEPVAEDVADALASITASGFDVAVHGAGYFGKAHMARAIWAGIESNAELKVLHERIEHTLEACGIPAETRKFKPHVTLARLRGAKAGDVERFAAVNSDITLPTFRADHFCLFESELGHGGAHYTVLERFPLSIRKPGQNLTDLAHIPAAE